MARYGIFSENSVSGYIPTTYANSRIEFVWAITLNAYMCPLNQAHTLDADIAIFILPKKNREFDRLPIVYKNMYPNSKVCVMQEGPIDYYLNYKPIEQWQHLWVLDNVDLCLTHNYADKQYLENLVKTPVKVLPTIYNENITPTPLEREKRNRVFVAGNMSKWYNGTPVFWILTRLRKELDLDFEICVTRSGRMDNEEVQFLQSQNITVLPWMLWGDWIHELNKSFLGINLMETRAAGTFNLNCAALDIPCIGFSDVDTQANIFGADFTIDKADYRTDSNKKLSEAILRALTIQPAYAIASTFERNIDNSREKIRNLFND